MIIIKILVISDSHRRASKIFDAVEAHPDIEHIIFLGDGVDDFEQIGFVYPHKKYYAVSGNCDFASTLPTTKIIKLNGKVIYACHGHLHQVKEGYDRAITAAKEAGADILLFGHTHIALSTYYDGVQILNPGSIGAPRDSKSSYGIIEITDKGIVTNIVQ